MISRHADNNGRQYTNVKFPWRKLHTFHFETGEVPGTTHRQQLSSRLRKLRYEIEGGGVRLSTTQSDISRGEITISRLSAPPSAISEDSPPPPSTTSEDPPPPPSATAEDLLPILPTAHENVSTDETSCNISNLSSEEKIMQGELLQT
ncbi:unnamed protein product [Phytophthora fragariaefolia]|uniref:Unnamed protein product n=1 Tax=Phytophthora fragariaefolia TaxID=1490495 RepID=A0A9W6XEJ0_9STRA|nr:unnamed protein product [Phytophthora fragariaefolia]